MSVTKMIRQYFITCLTNDNKSETFQVPQNIYKYSDNNLLNYLKPQSDKRLLAIERRFTTESAFWMSDDDFIKFADKGRVYVSPKGKTKILPIRKDDEWFVREEKNQ